MNTETHLYLAAMSVLLARMHYNSTRGWVYTAEYKAMRALVRVITQIYIRRG